MIIFCDKCGHQNRKTAKFCQGCGGEIISITDTGILQSGAILDKRYEIKRLIKSGGMGAVYEASDHRFDDTRCAVKEMLNISTDPQGQQYFIESFKKEAKILRNLRHYNLPGVIDYFIEAGRYYLVMDYIEGKDLETLLQDYGGRGVPENLVIEWTMQILDALDYLHNQSPPIVYRDLKPANVMLQSSDNKIMLIDFGIARTVQPGSDKTKTSIGTPAFAPTEIFQGKPEARSDIYSLGATMHCLLTGIIPAGPFNFAPVNTLNPSVSGELSSIVMKALDMKIENRYSGAQEMKRSLEEFSGKSVLYNKTELSLPGVPLQKGSTVPSGFYPHSASPAIPYTVPQTPAVPSNFSPPPVLPATPSTVPHIPTVSVSSPSQSITSQVPSPPSSSDSAKLIKKALMPVILIVSIFALIVFTLIVGVIWNIRNKEIYCKEGNDLLAQKKYEEAITYYDKALKIAPTCKEAWHNKGVALFNLGKYTDAVTCYEEALRLQPDNDSIWCNKGNALFRNGDYKEALVCYDKALEIAPGNSEAAKNKEKAEKQIQYSELLDEGDKFYNSGEYDKAIEAYDKASKIIPDSEDLQDKQKKALVVRGDELFEEKNYSDAIYYYNRVLKIDSEDDEAWNSKGRSYFGLGKNDEAIKCFDKVLKINPEASWAWYNKGLAYRNLKKYDQSIICSDKALEIDPKYSDAWFNKGWVYAEQEKYNEAITCYDKVLKIDPKDSDAWFEKGWLYHKLGKYNEAITCYDKSLKIEPGESTAWNNKGVAYQKLGKKDMAISCYKKALELDPDYTTARDNLTNLRGW